jgi:hypothetical protein
MPTREADEKVGPASRLPWAAIWLFYFEEWLASGEWKGGGEHPHLSD